MRTNFLSVSSVFFIALLFLFTGQARAQAGHLIFTAHMTGAEEVPAVTTDGEGLITVLISDDRSTMQVNGAISNLSGPATAAHFHAGNLGSNGGVMVDLSPIRSGNRFSGELPVPAGFISKALTLGLYANVHTAANPGGEIRGQLRPQSDLRFGGVLNSLNEVPPVLASAIGVGGITITQGHNKLKYQFVIRGLSGPITASHIHEGAVGVAGPVVVALSFNGNVLSGELDMTALPTDFMTKLLAGEYYVNVHTAANPAGEIRAQLTFNGYLNGFAILNGDQETPPVTSNGFGIGFVVPNINLDSIVYGVLVDGLSGPATAAHVHKGPAGQAGGVEFALAPGPLAGLYTATVALDNTRLTDFLHNNWYFNVHTAANPAGEIRGQIQTNLRKAYAFDLCAAQEVPANNSTAYGAGMASIDQNNQALNYQLFVDGLSGPATAAHIHNGDVGTSGGVKFALVTPAPYSEGAIPVTINDAAQIEDQGTYMNVHTAANPGGEVRGQVRRSLSCSLASAVFDPVVSDLQIFPNPVADAMTVRLNSRESLHGQLRLTDVTGRILVEQSADAGGNGLQEWTVPVRQLAPGVYYLYLQQNGTKVFVQQVVKM